MDIVRCHFSKRAEWEAEFKAREAEAQRQCEEAERQREHAEWLAARRKTIVKATPITQYPPIVIHPMTKGVTVPQSPLLRTKLRARERAMRPQYY